MDTSSRILISGAGVAGLTAAIWLGRAGFRPVVVERAEDVRADGYIISLSHRSYRYAEALDLLDEIDARSAGIVASSYHRTGHGPLLELDYGRLFQGVDVVQIMRDDLQNILYEQARDLADFRFGTSIAELRADGPAAQVTLSDGSEAGFDVVIGADGAHSNVRDLAFPPGELEERHLGLCSAAFRLPNILGLSAKFETHMERDRYMVVFTTREGGLASVFVWQTDMPGAPPAAERAAVLRAAFAGAPAPTARVLEHCPDDGAFYMDPLVQVRLPRWHAGPAVLVGDAAHCMTLISGQGATMAFTGACALCERLVALPATEAFRAYEADLRATVIEVQDRTRDAARWYVPRSAWRRALRDGAMWMLPRTLFERHFRTKYSRA